MESPLAQFLTAHRIHEVECVIPDMTGIDPIPWGLLKYDTDKRGYLVPLDKDTLSKAPRYTRDEAPTYTREYGSRVDMYYSPYL